MRQVWFAAFALVSLTACDASYTDVTAPSHDCTKAASIAIRTSGGAFTLSGTCDSVLVAGSNNKLTIDTVKALEIRGDSNTVATGSVGRINLRGDGNKVSYKTGNANVTSGDLKGSLFLGQAPVADGESGATYIWRAE